MTIIVPIMELSEIQGYFESQIQEDNNDVKGDFGLGMCNRFSQALFDALGCGGHVCFLSRFKPNLQHHLHAAQQLGHGGLFGQHDAGEFVHAQPSASGQSLGK